jgi:hypothetical protein
MTSSGRARIDLQPLERLQQYPKRGNGSEANRRIFARQLASVEL